MKRIIIAEHFYNKIISSYIISFMTAMVIVTMEKIERDRLELPAATTPACLWKRALLMVLSSGNFGPLQTPKKSSVSIDQVITPARP